jgi:hypothetical protein
VLVENVEFVHETSIEASWPGLSRPSTPCFSSAAKEDVDARDKRGHDAETKLTRPNATYHDRAGPSHLQPA